jgi:hypothetical protein
MVDYTVVEAVAAGPAQMGQIQEPVVPVGKG